MARYIRSGPGHRRHLPSRPAGTAKPARVTVGTGQGAATAEARPRELLLRVGRDLLRGIATGEEANVVIDRAIGMVRDAGRYPVVRYRPGEGFDQGVSTEDPSRVTIVVGVNGRQHGLLEIETDPRRPPDEDELLLLEECADDLALALHVERLEQVRRQNLLRILESEERFRQVFHQTNDAILLYELSPDGREHRCLEANQQACRWLGYSQDELRRHRPGDLIEPPAIPGSPPWDRPEPAPVRFDASVLRREGATTAEICLHRFDLLGREAMLIVARDVAEERQREHEKAESLRQIQQNMEQFQILNDQIRNPVQVIIGLADMDGGEVGSQIIQQAQEIDDIVRRLDVGWLESAKVTAYLRRYST